MIHIAGKLRQGLCLGFFVALVFAPLSWAQLSSTGTISGGIADTTGASVPGAAITVTNDDTKVSAATESNNAGNFVVPGLPVGTYTVTITKQGFQTYTAKGVILHPPS